MNITSRISYFMLSSTIQIQDGVQDPFQEDSHDPWKGEPKASDDNQEEKGQLPEEHQMYTPPQGPRVSVSPMPCGPPGLGGQPSSGKAAADKKSFMLSCEDRLKTLYACIGKDYD